MTVKQLATKLRHAADVLDELIGLDRPTKHEHSGTARKIVAALGKRKKKHWTQTSEGRRRMSQMMKKRHTENKR